jgi:hypothetical protein
MKKLFLFLGLGMTLLFADSSVKAGLTNAVYWDFFTGGASPTSNSFSGLTVSSLSQGNSGASVALLSATSPSSANPYTTAAGFPDSGTTNAEIVAPTGILNLGASGSAFFAFSFSLGLSSPFSYNVTNISFGSRSTGTGPQTLSLYDSTDGFASSHFIGSISVLTNSTWAAESFNNLSVLIPNNAGTISFRIFGSDGVGSAGSSANWRIDDLGVALSPAPEPSTVALIAVGWIFSMCSLGRFMRKGENEK